MRQRPLALVLALSMGMVALPRLVAAQTAVSIDRIVARIGDDVVQSLDVRQARVLKLFGADLTESAVLDRLIDRRLVLADVSRYQSAEPAAADVWARRELWMKSIGNPSAASLAALLRDAGMSESALTVWFRDDLRIEAVESQRFSIVPASHEEVVTYVREHASEFAVNGQLDVEDAAVQTRARDDISAAKRGAAIAAWIETLRKRAQIIR